MKSWLIRIAFMSKLTLVTGLFVSLIFQSCGDPALPVPINSEKSFPFFDDFPDSIFYGVYVDQNTELAVHSLNQNGFKLIDSSATYVFMRTEDSIDVYLPDQKEVKELKVFLRSEKMIRERNKLIQGFVLQSKSSENSTDYNICEYDYMGGNMKVSIFTDGGFIRIHMNYLETR